ncbi:hypothetical protein HLV37_02065 [Eggerthellaceae bacterium zg-1084]|uniref:Uncharacterized protein n=1 Tax=Berryella wangjianweii TaxID=2734634 RepID=A0A6M8J7C9_9ACTN|nr:glucosaminidase domain-containing protein [Berryella wangjianweii]NPD30665.1 hypothetical protein [Berryella wangjianweii]NPD32117.1 hypothetical protein [Eggerthellaceae bacterium zg-997]QKF07309.1 hypothetical protein HLV38_03630 [Berryella wangjianweii]
MPVPHACAEDIDTNPSADALQQRVESTSQAYLQATAQLEQVNALIAQNTQQIARLNAQMPDARRHAGEAAASLYKAQRNAGSVLTMIVDVQSFGDFLTNLDYVLRATDKSMDKIKALGSLQQQLEKTASDLTQQKSQAQQAEQEAQAALDEAREAREEAQRQAAEQARMEEERRAREEEQARAQAADKAAQKERETAKDAAAKPSESSSAPAAVAGTEVDWSQDAQAFVAAWGPRIDAYLAGSPLAGQGTTFAQAAWAYGIDPRFSPAIATVESSKGAALFKPYNAWGWGSVSWNSWEEAINAHAAGLARGYGRTLTLAAAQKYCPPTWQHWHDSVSAQMAMI